MMSNSPAHLADGLVNMLIGQAYSLQETGSQCIEFTKNLRENMLTRSTLILHLIGPCIGKLENSCRML